MYSVQPVDIYVRYSKATSEPSTKPPSTCFEKLGTLSQTNQLIYNVDILLFLKKEDSYSSNLGYRLKLRWVLPLS